MPTPDAKSARILDSSLPVFCTYGFQKTSMQDIARAAGMSRAALYLHFANKEDVFRSGAVRTHAAVMGRVEAELGQPGDVFERIEAALVAYFEGLVEQIAASPHGAELFDASAELVGDVVLGARRRLIDLLRDALGAAERRGEIHLSGIATASAELAVLLLATVDGVKAQRSALLPVRPGIVLQLRLLRAAIQPAAAACV
ncbi:TetR/AcrR family transcriptional regulator [Microterricola viridarii]|uniref:TetR/AcrR family transcriptional regulator n=1 Tax=Microterricola viridarii TaxID=412690 RepID=UPI001561AB33|nr:TetR/AcrR family transcriptional regulator [Microterricola viridarii]